MAKLSYKTDYLGNGDYIVADGANVHISWFKTGNLERCDLEKIKIFQGDDWEDKSKKEVVALSLKKSNFMYTVWRGREGVFVPPFLSDQDIILNSRGSQTPRFTTGVFIEGRDLRFDS
jgi:hypothetical protein